MIEKKNGDNLQKITLLIVVGLLLTTSIVNVNAAINQKEKAMRLVVPIYADLYVDDDAEPGGDGSYEHPFHNISNAINASENGDKIFVFDGLYDGLFTIPKEITLKGQSRENTKIDIKYITTRGTIQILSSNVTIEDFSIFSTEPKNEVTTGILMAAFGLAYWDQGPLDNINILDCDIFNHDTGMFVYNATNLTIENCNFYNNQKSIVLQTMLWDFCNHDILINDCNIYSCGYFDGEWYTSPGISILFFSELINPRQYNIIIKNNEIHDNIGPCIFAGYCKNVKVFKNTVENNEWGGIVVANSKNFKVIANNIINNDYIGVWMNGILNSNSLIYCNNLIDNYINGWDEGLTNYWCVSSKSKGNYWSDYNGIDILPPYGIGDIPYLIPGKTIPSVDWYPFMDQIDIDSIDDDEINVEVLEYPSQQQSTPISPPNELNIATLDITIDLQDGYTELDIEHSEESSVTLNGQQFFPTTSFLLDQSKES